MSRGRRATAHALHFVASVLMLSGALLLLDAGVTLAWQEPVSAWRTAQEQGDLEQKLDEVSPLIAQDKKAVEKEFNPKARLAKRARLWSRRTDTGDPIGKIDIPRIGKNYVVVEGTDLGTLRKGPGHYPKTPFPGEGGTVAVAGHRTTYGAPFRAVDKLKKGDKLIMDMPYGKFTYSVDKVQIVKPTDTWVTRKRKHEALVLSACHPLYSAAERIIVFSHLTKSEPK
jgi:sortase A